MVKNNDFLPVLLMFLAHVHPGKDGWYYDIVVPVYMVLRARIYNQVAIWLVPWPLDNDMLACLWHQNGESVCYARIEWIIKKIDSESIIESETVLILKHVPDSHHYCNHHQNTQLIERVACKMPSALTIFCSKHGLLPTKGLTLTYIPFKSEWCSFSIVSHWCYNKHDDIVSLFS